MQSQILRYCGITVHLYTYKYILHAVKQSYFLRWYCENLIPRPPLMCTGQHSLTGFKWPGRGNARSLKSLFLVHLIENNRVVWPFTLWIKHLLMQTQHFLRLLVKKHPTQLTGRILLWRSRRKHNDSKRMSETRSSHSCRWNAAGNNFEVRLPTIKSEHTCNHYWLAAL